MLNPFLAGVLGHTAASPVPWEAGGQGKVLGSGSVATVLQEFNVMCVCSLRCGAQLGVFFVSVLSKLFNSRKVNRCSQGKYGVASC